jgi:hypothetical protein
VLTPVAAELVSDTAQTFEIVADDTTRISYRFVVAAGTLAFGGGEPESSHMREPGRKP